MQMTSGDVATYRIRSLSEDHTNLDNPGFSSLLDAMRWIAALCVVTTHTLWRVLLPLAEQDSSLFATLFYALNSFGHQAVIVFFVLSGYLVGGKGVVGVARAQFDVRNYLSARAARLYAVILPALLLTGIADWLSIQISGGTGFHSMTGYDNQDLWTALINILMLQHFYGPAFGSNTPLWSLSYEFWFYMMFAVFAQIRIKHGASRWCYAALAGSLVILLGTSFIHYSLMWLIGLVAAVAPRQRAGMISAVAATILFIVALTSTHYTHTFISRFGSDLYQSIAAGVMLWTLKTSELVPLVRFKPLNTFLADFSYSLYAVHYPLILLFLTLLGGPASPSGYSMGFVLEPASIGLFLAVVGTCVISAWLFSLVTERKTKVLRGWIQQVLDTTRR